MSTVTLPTAAAAPAGSDDTPPPAGSRRKKLVVIGLAVVLVAGIAAFLLLRGGSEHEAAAAPVPGQVVDLEPLTLNLADGRFLKVGLSLQLAAGSHGGEAEGETFNGAKARDAAIAVFGQRTYAQLLAPKGRDSARQALDAEVQRRYPDEVLGVYLTEFVMQ
jgi:flagellar FliL protein